MVWALSARLPPRQRAPCQARHGLRAPVLRPRERFIHSFPRKERLQESCAKQGSHEAAQRGQRHGHGRAADAVDRPQHRRAKAAVGAPPHLCRGVVAGNGAADAALHFHPAAQVDALHPPQQQRGQRPAQRGLRRMGRAACVSFCSQDDGACNGTLRPAGAAPSAQRTAACSPPCRPPAPTTQLPGTGQGRRRRRWHPAR